MEIQQPAVVSLGHGLADAIERRHRGQVEQSAGYGRYREPAVHDSLDVLGVVDVDAFERPASDRAQEWVVSGK